VHQLEIKVLNITDARCNHEVYKDPISWSYFQVILTAAIIIYYFIFRYYWQLSVYIPNSDIRQLRQHDTSTVKNWFLCTGWFGQLCWPEIHSKTHHILLFHLLTAPHTNSKSSKSKSLLRRTIYSEHKFTKANSQVSKNKIFALISCLFV